MMEEYLLILLSEVFGMIAHPEHLGEHLRRKYRAFRIGDFNFLFRSTFTCQARFALGL